MGLAHALNMHQPHRRAVQIGKALILSVRIFSAHINAFRRLSPDSRAELANATGDGALTSS